MIAVVQIADQEDPELTGRKIGAVPADLIVGDRIGTSYHVRNGR